MGIQVEKLEAEVDVDAKKASAELKMLDKVLDRVAQDRIANIVVNVDHRGLVRGRDELGQYHKAQILTSEGNANLTSSFRKLNSAVGAGGSMVKLMAIPALISAIQPAITGINSLAAGVLGLTSALGPLSGYLATIPTGLTALGGALGSVSLAMSEVTNGIKDIDAAKTSDEMKAALGRLSPSARSFVDLVRNELQPALGSLRAASSSAFLPGFEKGIQKALPNIGMLNNLLVESGSIMGQAASKFGDLLNSGPFQKDFARITATSGTALRNLTDAINPLISGLARLAAESAPLVNQLSLGVLNLANSFDKATQSSQSSGGMAEFFEKAAHTGRQLVDIIKNVGGAIGDVLSAANNLGTGLLGSLESGAESMQKWTNEAENMERMKSFFDELRGPLDAAGRLLRALVDGWMELNNAGATTMLLDQITNDLVPSLVKVADAANDAFGPKLIDTISDLVSVLGSLMGHSGALSMFVDLIGELASAFNSLNSAVPMLTELIAAFGVWKLAMGGMNLVMHTRSLGTFFEVMRAGGTATQAMQSSLRSLSAGLGGVASAIGLVAAAWVTYKSKADAAEASGRAVIDGIRSQMDAVTPANIQFDELSNIIGGLEGDMRDLDQAIDNAWDPIKIKGLKAQREEAEKLRGEYSNLRINILDIARATGMSNDEATEYVLSNAALRDSLMGVADATKIASATSKEYISTLRVAVAESKKAMEAAFATRDSLIESAAAADDELAEAQRDYSRTLRDNVVDTRALESAQESAADAAKALAESYHLAAEHLEDLRFAQRRSVLSEVRAVNALQDAYDRLNSIQQGVGKTTKEVSKVTDYFTGKIYEVTRITADAADAAQDQKKREKELRDALLDIAEAQLALEIARDASLDAQLELTEAEKKGITQSDLVVAAQRRMRDANYAVRDAIKAQKEQAEQNALAQERAADRVEQAAKRQKQAHQAVRDYVNGPLRDAINAYNRDLDKLNRAVKARIEFEIYMDKQSEDNLTKIMAGVLLGEGTTTPASQPGAESIESIWDKVLNTQAHARGGFAPYNQTALFGEHGPEIATPHPSGTGMNILPAGPTANALAGGGGLTKEDLREIAAMLADARANVDIDIEMDGTQDPSHLAGEIAWRVS